REGEGGSERSGERDESQRRYSRPPPEMRKKQGDRECGDAAQEQRQGQHERGPGTKGLQVRRQRAGSESAHDEERQSNQKPPRPEPHQPEHDRPEFYAIEAERLLGHQHSHDEERRDSPSRRRHDQLSNRRSPHGRSEERRGGTEWRWRR